MQTDGEPHQEVTVGSRDVEHPAERLDRVWPDTGPTGIVSSRDPSGHAGDERAPGAERRSLRDGDSAWSIIGDWSWSACLSVLPSTDARRVEHMRDLAPDIVRQRILIEGFNAAASMRM